MMADLDSFHRFLRRARRRALAAVLLDQGLLATGAALAGAILLLLLGSQILEWYWPALLLAGGFALGLHRMLRRVPSEYRVAQEVDRRLDLDDHLATAYYFANPAAKARGSMGLRELVLQRAIELCDTITPTSAVPLRAPRSAYAVLVLAVVALALFGIRFRAQGGLELGRPLMVPQMGIFRPEWLNAKLRPALRPQAAPVIDADSDASNSIRSGTLRDGGANQAGPDSLGRENAIRPWSSGQGDEDAGLLDKMRDAFESILAKLKSADGAGETAQTIPEAGRAGSKNQKEAGQRGEIPQNGAPEQGASRPNEHGNLTNLDGEMAQAVRGRKSERSVEQSSGGGEAGGIGKSEGDKAIREAEQLAAMGRISELLGRRRASLTGEITVESPPGRQQDLKTPYTERGAVHSSNGGEIHRDEIPMIYQQYVLGYFDQVRAAAE
jgi:hypothetical protein